MKNQYKHITEMENIMVRQENTLRELEKVLDKLDKQQEDYAALFAYYYSDQRQKDLEDEENHRLPEDLRRGVLSEDEVYNLIIDVRDAGLHMMETALNMLKVN